MAFTPPTVQFQAQHHPVVSTTGFKSLEEYCLYLIHLKAYQAVIELARERAVLDLGCNAGYGSALLGKYAATVVGVDVSARALREAERVHMEHVHFVLVDGVRLPFPDHRFDLITSFQVIEHIRDYEMYLSEIKRVLVPGGVVIFATPNATLRLDPGMQPWNEFHVHEFTAYELRVLLLRYFPNVHLRGLFAHEPLYSVERNRVQRARKAARRRATWRFGLRSRIKSLLPQSVIERARLLRDVQLRDGHAIAVDASVLEQYSTADLFYEDRNLENALDLLAICSTTS